MQDFALRLTALRALSVFWCKRERVRVFGVAACPGSASGRQHMHTHDSPTRVPHLHTLATLVC